MMNFDWNTEAPTTTQENDGFSPIPKGDYIVAISDMHWKEKKDGSGKYINVHWQVVGGKYDNRRIFQVLSPSSKSGYAQLMLRTVLMNNLTAEQLKYFKKLGSLPDDNAMQKIYIGKKMKAYVTIQESDRGAQNNISGLSVYDPFAEAPTPPSAPAADASYIDIDIPF